MHSVVKIAICIIIFISSTHLQNLSIIPPKAYFSRYLRYQEIQEYLNALNTTLKDLVKVRNYGLSVERRNLTYIEISSDGEFNKPLILVDAGIHAREWIGPAEALYVIHQLVENPDNFEMINDVDWIIIPLVNPDGYEYAHTRDRLWRKNRSRGEACRGVDLNRNFGYAWGTVGTSDKQCTTTFAGSHPFSEPESVYLSNLILKNAGRIKMYISLHAAAKKILYPWACYTDLPENDKELHRIAAHMANTVFNHNSTEYIVGTFANAMYLGSGTSTDWAYAVANISLVFTIEIKNTTIHRFEIPHREILSVVQETFQAFRVLPYYVQAKYGSHYSPFKRISIP